MSETICSFVQTTCLRLKMHRMEEIMQASAQTRPYNEKDYYNLPEDIRAELIYGQFYNMAAPSRMHQAVLSELHALIHSYLKLKNGVCRIYPAPFAVKLFEDDQTIVEPDISVICDRNKLTDKGCSGAPDWIIEISSPGNPGHDYVRKLNLYMDAGVREYWIVNPLKELIYVYHLEETRFETMPYTFQDKIKVNIYEDLWIDFKQLDLR